MKDLDLLFHPQAQGMRVTGLAWRPAHNELLGLWSEAAGPSWWLFREDGSRVELARPANFGAESAQQVLSVTWTHDGQALLIHRERAVSLWNLETRRLTQLTQGIVHAPTLTRRSER